MTSLVAVSLLLRSRRYVLLRRQRILSRTAGALTGLVLASWGFALWVESLGDTCFRC